MILVDLHLHSTFSDGSLIPEQLADMGKHRGLSVMSLTDHDTTAGLPSFMAACSRLNVRAIAGIELSADYPSTMHILGYRLDFSHPRLEKILESVRKARDLEKTGKCAATSKLGFDLTLEGSGGGSCGGMVCPPHTTWQRSWSGWVYVQDGASSFSRYLGNSGPV